MRQRDKRPALLPLILLRALGLLLLMLDGGKAKLPRLDRRRSPPAPPPSVAAAVPPLPLLRRWAAAVLASAWRSTKTDKQTADTSSTCPARGEAAPARPFPAAAWLWPPALLWGCWPWPSGVRPAPVGLAFAPASPSVVLLALVALNRRVAFVFLRNLAPVIAQQFLATRRALLPLRLDKGCNPLRMARPR